MLFTQKNPSLGESPGDRAELLSENNPAWIRDSLRRE